MAAARSVAVSPARQGTSVGASILIVEVPGRSVATRASSGRSEHSVVGRDQHEHSGVAEEDFDVNKCVATSKSRRYQGVIAFSPRLFSPDALLDDAPLLSCIIRLPPFGVLKRDLSMRDQVVVR